jgi:hypothetical protein
MELRPRPPRTAREYVPPGILAGNDGSVPAGPDTGTGLAELAARAAEDTRRRACAFCDGEGYGRDWKHDGACPLGR